MDFQVEKIDIHTHIMPKSMPSFAKRFGYGGFIELEHHAENCARMLRSDGSFFREVGHNCWDLSVRLSECDAHGVDMQVLSTIPVLFYYWARAKDALEVSQFLNDHIAQAVLAHPRRFMGLATLPMQDPQLAIGELTRCVKELGLAGFQMGSHVGKWNLDHPNLFPVFEAAQTLGACVFVHPWEMMGSDVMPDYWLPWLVGMPAETARAICSMIFGGVFRRLPDLRVAFAHGGGAFAATIGRIEHGFKVRPDLCAVNNDVNPRDYLGHFYLDSLVHDASALHYLLEHVGAGRIALGSDYPFPLGEGRPGSLIESMSELSQETKSRLLVGTAQEWLGLDKRAS